jgi:long-chain acyl-CoA synthetase
MNSPWTAYYPDSARNFDASNIGASHLAEVPGQAADRFGKKPAVSTQLPSGACATLDFRTFDDLSDKLAVYLRETAGLRAGDCVAVMSPNCIGFTLAVFGIFKAGCICTNINPLYTAREMAHQLEDSRARVLFIIDLFGDKVDAVIDETCVNQVITLSLLDFLPQLEKVTLGFLMKRVRKMIPDLRHPHVRLAEALKQGARQNHASRPDIDAYRRGQTLNQTALYQYTGGTTGRSKGAELSHRNILCDAESALALIDEERIEDPENRSLVVLPLYHITAFSLIMLPGFLLGQHNILIPSPRPPSNLRAAFERHRISRLTGINTLFAALLAEPWLTRDKLRHLKFCSSGGAAQHVAVAERWEELTGLPILQGYGLTEVAGVLTMNPPNANRPGSVGVPVPGSDVKIVNDEGEELPAGQAGEVIASGPTIMKGYLNRPEETREALSDGWLRTGDIGIMDEDGFLWIVDRKKDMILVSGFNVYPNEVEDVIAGLNGVVEVGVVGVPNDKTGEAVKAFVVSSDPALTAEQVMDHCRASLTNYKRPSEVEFVKDIPKSPVGKILRRDLREQTP